MLSLTFSFTASKLCLLSFYSSIVMAYVRMLATAGFFLNFVLPVISLPTISVIGAKFFDSDGNQFFIKGNSLSQSRANEKC